MKRLHIHIAVDDIDTNVGFYSALFDAAPTVVKPDYAKWMLDEPKVNFAISSRGAKPGLDHLGIQVESDEELHEINARLSKATLPVVEEMGTACCYSESDKYWTQDPQGIPWEAFHSLQSVPVFGGKPKIAIEVKSEPTSCCSPSFKGKCS